jgi:hypothetical protein
MKGENIMRINDVKFSDVDSVQQLLKLAGVVKKPGTSLVDLQKASLNLYSPKTLQLYCQFLSPGSYIEEDKKIQLIDLILQRLSDSNVNRNAVVATPLKTPLQNKQTNKSHSSSVSQVTPFKEDSMSKSSPTKLIINDTSPPVCHVTPCGVPYIINEHPAGYSKNQSVLQLEKAFKFKKIRRFSREAALHFLLIQTNEKFVILNQSEATDMNTLTREFIYSKTHCCPSVVGWDIFATHLEAISVRDRLLSKKSSSGSHFSVASSSVESSSDSSVNFEPTVLQPTQSIRTTITSSLNKESGSMNEDDSSNAGIPEQIDFSINPSNKGKKLDDGGNSASLLGLSCGHDESLEVKGAKKRLVMHEVIKPEEKKVSKIPKLKNFSYDKSKLKRSSRDNNSTKIEIVVSYPMPSKNGNERHVIVIFFFNKPAFKTSGIHALLETASENFEDDDIAHDWIETIRVVNRRKKPYGPNESDLVGPANRYPKSEVLLFPLIFDRGIESESIRSSVDTAIELIMGVLRSNTAVEFYQEYLKDQHERLWEKLCDNAVNNKTNVAEYTKHFIGDFIKNEPNIAYNVSLYHFLVDDDIRLIVNKMDYNTANDMIEGKFNCKMLYKDVKSSDVPAWMTESVPVAMPYNIVN